MVLNSDIERRDSLWPTVAAAACFVIAVLAAVAGILLTTGWILNSQIHPRLHAVGVVLLILAFPILILGGHCLDLRDKRLNRSGNDSQVHGPGKTLRVVFGFIGLLSTVCVSPARLQAQEVSPTQSEVAAQNVTEIDDKEDLSAEPSLPKWQYGGFADLGYLLNFNHPANHLLRSRGTAFRVDSVFLNMAGLYVRKKATEQSRWGVEATAHAGKDAEVFGFSATAPNIGGYKFLRQLGPTNVSYLAPVGKGLTLQAGIFGSLIGYDSLYAKDNLNYTRPWGADFTPYFMMGANASYPLNEKVTGTLFVINGYWHLARANNVPSSGGQIAYKLNPRVTVKETVLFGPHQSNTDFKFWRFLTDTIVERKADRFTVAFEYTYSQERVDAPGRPRALMMSSQVPTRWTMNDRWSLSFRPEVFWDRDGRWTLAKQTVKAVTTTLEYRLPYRWTNSIFRLEHRFDDSRGPDGGFFRGREVQPGVVSLTPNQHLLIFATIFTFDR